MSITNLAGHGALKRVAKALPPGVPIMVPTVSAEAWSILSAKTEPNALEAAPVAIATPATPPIVDRVLSEPGFGDDDLDVLENAARRLPGGGLRELSGKYSCSIGRNLFGSDRRGIYYAQITRSGRIEAADTRGTLPFHAMAITAELGWQLPQFRERLSCELRPISCCFVNVERLAELARPLTGLVGEPELSPNGLRLVLDGTSAARAGLPMNDHRAGCCCGCAVRVEVDAVIDIGFSGHVSARMRARPTGYGPHGERYDEAYSSSLPVLAGRVMAELKAIARSADAEPQTAQLFTSEILL